MKDENGKKMFKGMSIKKTGHCNQVERFEVNYCDSGHSYSSVYYFVLVPVVSDRYREATKGEIKKFKEVENEELAKFKVIAAKEGITAATQQTAIR